MRVNRGAKRRSFTEHLPVKELFALGVPSSRKAEKTQCQVRKYRYRKVENDEADADESVSPPAQGGASLDHRWRLRA